MLPIWAEAFSDACDEDAMSYSIQKEFSGLNVVHSDNIGCKVVTQIRKLASFLERGVVKGAICFLTGTGTIFGAIEQITKKAEHSINETVEQLSGTDRGACKDDEILSLSCLGFFFQ
ncbi:unnamed protein product [Onchocerca ochengi]|uniref:Senescence domain-containing protein n=1 Tax=Onchocerca ochengi TaxID=42157 RepID=A0A182DYY1_ONCOC|nr:unnamed protein product [Onchocerca ochengi]